MDVDAFRAEAAAWLSAHAPSAPPDYGAILPPHLFEAGVAWQRRLQGAGYAGISWPVEFGGQGLDPSFEGAWIEECARAAVPAYINMVGYVLVGQGVLHYGTDTQKEQHLRAILSADEVWCQLFSEPEAGSDLASLRTWAERDGDTWVVEGHKVWCSAGRISNWGILLARTDRTAAKHKGISAFLVDMSLPGIEVRPLRQITGESDFDEVIFSGAVLPGGSLLGDVNQGWAVATSTLTHERSTIGAAQIGMQRRLDDLVRSGVAGDAIERDRLAGLVARGMALVAMGSRGGPAAGVSASLGKLGTSEMLFDQADFFIGAAGAGGTLESDVSRRLVGSTAARIAGGTSQIQRNIIGERVLGLPKEPGA